MEKKLVSNTGPLLALSLVHKVDLLQALFAEIRVPQSVRNEIESSSNKPAAGLFKENPWIQVSKDVLPPDLWLGKTLDRTKKGARPMFHDL